MREVLVIDPRAEYTGRLEDHLKIAASKQRLHIRCGNLKLLTIVLGIVVGLLALYKSLSPYWILLPVIAFAVLGIVHERILRARDHAQTVVALYRRGIARIDDNWAGTGSTGERFRDPKHVYADDLDLFGRGCLFELLSTARLPMGEDRLARWLCAASPVNEIIERQKLVAELRDRLDLREEIAVTGEDLRARLDAASLIAWAEGKPLLTGSAPRILFVLLSFVAITAVAFTGRTLLPLAFVLGVELVLYTVWRHRANEVMDGVKSNAEGLVLFSQILERIEREQFASPRLQKETAALTAGGRPASRAIRDFARIVFWMDAREGMIVRIIELPVLYSLQVAFAADAWRMRWGSKVRAWIDTVGEIEALLSLATYSFEHPADPFPQFVADEPVAGNAPHAVPIFEGKELGHPLIPASKCVRNSVHLDGHTRVMLVSGSNMSGKSTLLRTVGINTVLANAGAPVRGQSLQLSPVALGTRIRSTDSLQEGRSNFFTEILHIRQVFELMGDGKPLLFLFDELLEGTNSKDRRIGAEGLLRALIDHGSIGIVTTHDLALTAVTVSVGSVIRNFHFQDYVEAGQMRFDYTLREGVVAKSNAIELMRLIGLKV
jgi:hypothetical protein